MVLFWLKRGSEASVEGFFNSLGLSRKLARAIGNDEAPGLLTEGFYRYSVFSSSLDVSNHHLDLLVLAQRFIFRLRDRLEPLSVLAV
jgi:hypothetical protein